MIFAPQTPVTPDYVTNPQNYATTDTGELAVNRFGQPMSKLDTGSGGMSLMQTLAIVTAIVAPEAIPALAQYLGVSSAAAGAIYGGSSNALSTALNGGNLEKVVKAGTTGAASGYAGSEVAQFVGGAPEQAGPFVDSSGNVISGPGGTGVAGLTDSSTAGRVAGSTAGGATTGFTRAELSGSNLQSALRQGAIGGAAGAATGAISEGVQELGGSKSDARLVSALASPFVSQNVSKLFSPQTSSSTTGSRSRETTSDDTMATSGPSGTSRQGGPSTQQVGTTPTTGQGAPGSAALGQALRIGDPGAPIESPGGGESSRQPVWNIASLRVKDETGSSS